MMEGEEPEEHRTGYLDQDDRVDGSGLNEQKDSSYEEDDESDKEDVNQVNLALGQNVDSTITFLMLLQHWAVATHQTKRAMSLFLRLFKYYKPEPNYDSLPRKGETLLKIDKGKIPPVEPMTGGHYVHFGVEKAQSALRR